MIDFTWLDCVALLLLFLCWTGFNTFATGGRFGKRPSLSRIMDGYRDGWMNVMARRDFRMVDTMIQGSVLQGCTFFASTSILLVGALLALLGASDRGLEIVRELPFVVETSRALWQIKVLSVAMMLIYAFFKFAWAYRLYTYCIVVIGCTPIEESPESAECASRASGLLSLGARHFDRGIRAYYFTLATTAWFLHPLGLMLTTLWVTIVLLRREFHSRTRSILVSGGD